MPPIPLVQRSWEAGVISSLPPDKLPDNALAAAGNTAFVSTPGGTLALETRPGLRVVGEATGATGGATIVGVLPYTHVENGTRTNYVLGIASDGTLWSLASGGSTQVTLAADLGGGTLNGTKWVAVQANNRLYAVSGAGSGAERFQVYRQPGVGTLYTAPIGLTRPNAPTRASLSAGGMSGDWQFAVTWYSSYTGAESSLSDALTEAGLSSQQVTLNRPASPPSHATHWRIHVRGGGILAQWFQFAQVAVGTTTYATNVTAPTTLSILSPDTAENEPPATRMRGLAWHQSRLFYTDGVRLYFSKLGQPEQVDPENEIRVGENDTLGQIMALWPSSESSLLVLKERGAYLLLGDSPQSWEPRLLTASVGCVSRYVTEGDGLVTWWSAEGPVVWPKGGEPQNIAFATLKPLSDQGVLGLGTFDGAYAVAFDPQAHRFLYALPTTGAAAHWTVAPWSTTHKCWEATGWDFPPVQALASGRSLTTPAEFRVFLGSSAKTAYEVARESATDAAQNETGSRLVFPILAGATTTQVQFTDISSSLPTNPARTVCTLINLSTLHVHRSAYTVSGTTTKTITLTTAAPAAPPVNSLICFDVPVLDLQTKHFGTQLATMRLHTAALELESPGDVPICWGVWRNRETAPVRVWQENLEQTLDYPYDTLSPAELSGTTTTLAHRVGKTAKRWWLKVVGYQPGLRWRLTTLALTQTTRRTDV